MPLPSPRDAKRALETGILPPTINYQHPDPACDLSYVPNTAIEAIVPAALSNSLAFGGHNASLVFRRLDEEETGSGR